MELDAVSREITLSDTEWDLLARHSSLADGRSEGEIPDYSAALSGLLNALSGAPAGTPETPLGDFPTLDFGERVVAHTDGACSGNPGPGGWAVVISVIGEDGAEQQQGAELCDGAAHTTNNRMELTAVVKALGAAPRGAIIEIVTDSRYVVDGATRWMAGWKRTGWKGSDRKPVKNRDLWEQIGDLMETREVTFRWSKGHDGDALDERADTLARKMATSYGAGA